MITTGPFGYYVNLDERGDFYADVRDPTGETIFEIRSEDDGSIALIEDGFMRHKTDLDGLAKHLAALGLMDHGADLLASDRFKARLEDDYENLDLAAGQTADLATLDKNESARVEAAGLAALTSLEGGETDRGVWVRVTGRDASSLATRLSETAVSLWIESRFERVQRDNEVLPEFYLLVDDPSAPTRAHVTLAAAREADVTEETRVALIARFGHATGFRNENPYPEFAEEIDTLVRAEGLALKPNWMGRTLHDPEYSSDDGPEM